MKLDPGIKSYVNLVQCTTAAIEISEEIGCGPDPVKIRSFYFQNNRELEYNKIKKRCSNFSKLSIFKRPVYPDNKKMICILDFRRSLSLHYFYSAPKVKSYKIVFTLLTKIPKWLDLYNYVYEIIKRNSQQINIPILKLNNQPIISSKKILAIEAKQELNLTHYNQYNFISKT
ncbi:hypothetical protein AGLY_014300 [Aphis glycines]|uniref:Uncharacterized protein n=1 Tax=Aphis glycines TaxID=307491 RepID=A0A6G0T3Z3_APHGL|nr:hypothetical protein AGLY_014300 [Aphis glycines]